MYARHGTLTANQVVGVSPNVDCSSVVIVNVDGAAAIYGRIDGTDPTVVGDDCFVIPAAIGTVTLRCENRPTVRLRSTGTPKYAVMGLQEGEELV